jgi:hypothetical protein
LADQLHDARHLTYSGLELLWHGGAPLVLPVQGTPRCDLEIDPDAGRITLVTDYQVPEPELAKLQNISFEAVHIDGQDFARITVRVDQNIHGAYGLLAVIADELQIEKSPLAVAVAVGVEQYKDMLTARGGLTAEEEIGLIGELLFLDHLFCTIGSGPAVEAWKGPVSEEHDFVFDGFDLEVKTTVSERRRHMIAGLAQLVPRKDALLTLLSIQITRAAGADGVTLPGLVGQVRASAGGHVVELDRLLAGAGWKAEDADLYPTLWALRSTPRAYFVDAEFPAITAAALLSAIPSSALVSDVSYRVDVTDLEHDTLPAPLSEFAEPKGK